MKSYPEIDLAIAWFAKRKWKAFPFQIETWKACLDGKSGLLNAPTGAGKTYALFIGAALRCLHEEKSGALKESSGLKIIWITPIRALTRDIKSACEAFCEENNLPWTVAIRTGDTSAKDRQSQRRKAPEVLITTPESLHLLIATKGYSKYFSSLRFLVADEWHELMGSKRAVLLELALSRLRIISPLKIWGVSATIGNLDQAIQVLMGNYYKDAMFIKANIKKQIKIIPIIPDSIETYAQSGHLGIKLAHRLIPIIAKSKSTLVFTNTRSQAEIWYQHLLNIEPNLAGEIAMHHGSISRELRDWVEVALHEGRLKCVVCTSSLDLGVDFRPVETIVQIGSPKGVARFVQRAGRSGHAPGKASEIYFLPTHALQLIECAALKRAVSRGDLESRIPFIRSFDVLVQYLITLAVGEGFNADEIYKEIVSTYSFSSLSSEEWEWALAFITRGGSSLDAYEEFKKVEKDEEGIFKVTNRRTAMRHRLSIGAIVSDSMLQVKFQKGGYLGSIEEWFISRISPGDTFWFAGRPLELIRVKDMTVMVKVSKKKTGTIPSWQGGRMPLSAMLSENLRYKINQLANENYEDLELQAVKPIIEKQKELSSVPGNHTFLIEKIKTKEGCHLFVFPFDGRFVHEGLAYLLAYRLSLFKPITFSIALNDYGFELLSDQDIPIEAGIDSDIFSTDHLTQDIQHSLNKSEMARRRFRDIASIAGLVFKGFPGKHIKDRHLQSSSGLFFDVFKDFEPNSLLYKQAFGEVMDFQIEELRLRKALKRIQKLEIDLQYPEQATPFAFPILVERLRGRMTTEKLEDRIKKMSLNLD